MSDVVVRVDKISKRYRIGGKQERYKTFREAIVQTVRAPFRRLSAKHDDLSNTFWALNDVSFEVKRGEVLGIIGRNGAGKSTLLKILSRITEPTTGAIYLKGRVGALLEVGTGFHPELTGRENIYLSGTILGMTRAEVTRKFDEIIDFAGVEQFIDTPVKRYSSGMGLRLGFAVAAHLEPEILVVDEVLAVGDADFQKKCLGKMSEVAGQGRTVLFVSHNMDAVRNLCGRVVWLENGKLKIDTNVFSAIESYLKQNNVHGLYASLLTADRSGSQIALFEEVSISKTGTDSDSPHTGDDITVKVCLKSEAKIPSVVVCIVVWDSRGGRLIDANTGMKHMQINLRPNEVYEVAFDLKNVLLRPAE